MLIQQFSTSQSSDEPSAQQSTIHKDRSGFAELGLSKELLTALKAAGLQRPTNIQKQVIPEIMRSKRSAIMAAATGTGKTLAYLLPIIHRLREEEKKSDFRARKNRPRAIILTPNRELAQQILQVAKSLTHDARLKVRCISSGRKKKIQIQALDDVVDILVATPGRLLLHFEKGRILFSDVRYLVIDEADTMFDDGFREETEKIIHPIQERSKNTDKKATFIIASATFTTHLMPVLENHFKDATRVIMPSIHKGSPNLKHNFVVVPGGDKHDALLQALKNVTSERTIVFCNNVASCRSTDHFLNEQGHHTACFHSEIPIKQRKHNYELFVQGTHPILVCTDIASRGLDFRGDVSHVILFDFPLNPIDYLHRIGRTGRAGKSGNVTSLLRKGDLVLANRIEEAIKKGESLESLTGTRDTPLRKELEYRPEKRKKRVQATRGGGPRVPGASGKQTGTERK